MLSLESLTELSQELIAKQKELERLTSQLTQAISAQDIQTHSRNKSNLKKDVSELVQEITMFKKFFAEFLRDIKMYGQFPHEVMKMLKDLPNLYERVITATNQKWREAMRVKEEECTQWREKAESQQKQIERLKQEIELNKIEAAEIEVQDQVSQKQNASDTSIQIIGETMQDEEDDIISSIEVTLREYAPPECEPYRKITEQYSEEEECNNQENIIPNQLMDPSISCLFNSKNLQRDSKKAKKPVTARQQPIKHIKGLSDRSMTRRNYQKFEPKFLKEKAFSKTRKRTASSNNKANSSVNVKAFAEERFWKDLKSHINSKQNSPPKERARNGSLGKGMRDKGDLMSRLNDFRKLLFLDEGVKRYGLGV